MKKQLSKTIAIVLAAALSSLALTACGSTGAAPAPASSEAPAAASSAAEASAAEPAAEESGRLAAIKAAGKLTVATEPYFPPEEFIDPTKTGQEQYVGSDMELAKRIAEKLGVELEIVPLEFGPVLASVAEGKYDLAISALAYTPERAEALELSDGYHFTDTSTTYGLLIREEDKDAIKGPEDLADKIVVTQSGSLQEALITDQVPAYKEFKRVSSMSPDAFLSVQEGKADAAAVACENAQLYIDSNPDCGLMVLDTFYFTIDEKYGGERVAATKGETELIAVVNEVIKEVNESGEYEKWYEEYAEYAASLGL